MAAEASLEQITDTLMIIRGHRVGLGMDADGHAVNLVKEIIVSPMHYDNTPEGDKLAKAMKNEVSGLRRASHLDPRDAYYDVRQVCPLPQKTQ